MGLFDNVLKADETLFRNEDALDPEFVPKLLPYREMQQHAIAASIKPLLQERNGRNVFVFGHPGIGKTAAIKWVLRDLEENTDSVLQFYINCWQKNTTFKIYLELCEQLGIKFVQNKNTEEIFNILKQKLNKSQAVFVFDEIDRTEDKDFLYSILNDVYRKAIVLITNYQDRMERLESRIKSRLLPLSLEFKAYNERETLEILKQRIEYAFYPGVWEHDALELVAKKTAEAKDIRLGLKILREAGLVAEDVLSKKIIKEHVLDVLERISLEPKEKLSEDEKKIIELIKKNKEVKIGDLYKEYAEHGGETSYRNFQRIIKSLQKKSGIETEKVEGGKEGRTTKIRYQEKLTNYDSS